MTTQNLPRPITRYRSAGKSRAVAILQERHAQYKAGQVAIKRACDDYLTQLQTGLPMGRYLSELDVFRTNGLL